MPGPTPVAVKGDQALPARVDVVVIGGGIIGVSTALELAERGVSVALCEKGVIGGEQSSRNWGWVRISQRDPREVPLMAEAIRIWQGLDARIGGATGYRQCGIAFVSTDPADEARNEKWPAELARYQLRASMVGPLEFAALYPGLRLPVRSALYTPADGRAEPQRAAPAICEGARAQGAHILTACAVRGIETAGGRICGVATERGAIACGNVVLAGGAWSGLFCRSLGIDLPQLKVMNSVLRTGPVPDGPDVTLSAGEFAFRRREDGGYTVAAGDDNVVDIVPDSFRHGRRFIAAYRTERASLRFRLSGRFLEEALLPSRWRLDAPSPFEAMRVLDAVPAPARSVRAFERLRALYPAFSQATILQHWAGLIDVTPDAVPVISPVEAPRGPQGLVIATGFSGHGFGIGPAAGRLAADLVTGTTPCVDPHPFRLSRFSDGSRIELVSGF